jgi:hypothetical protein
MCVLPTRLQRARSVNAVMLSPPDAVNDNVFLLLSPFVRHPNAVIVAVDVRRLLINLF